MTWLIVAVAWAGWLVLVTSVVAETIRQFRQGIRSAHDHVHRIPPYRWISGLVAAAILATSAGTAAATPASPATATAPPRPHPQPDAVPRQTNGTPGSSAAAAVAATSESGQSVDGVSYTVVRGDTLWGLAERYLGDGLRYHEIVRLNPALLERNPDELEPEWTLWLPADAAHLLEPQGTVLNGHTVEVQPGDTLSSIAERELGDPNAWPDIAILNNGRKQSDGRTFRHPDEVAPGWTLLLPERHARPGPPGQPAPPRRTPPPTTAPRPNAPTVPPPPRPGDHQGDPDHRAAPHGVSLPTGGFVGLGFAVLITLAATVARLRRRRLYRPGKPEQPDPTNLPVVRALQSAYDSATRVPDEGSHLDSAPVASNRGKPADVETRTRALAAAQDAGRDDGSTVVAVRNRQEIALDLARTGGLGLTGPGAMAAARALTVSLLAQAASEDVPLQIVSPIAEARHLFEHDMTDRLPHQLRIVDSLPAALDHMEAELLTRSRQLVTEGPEQRDTRFGLCLLVAAANEDVDRRARAVLDNGARLHLAALFLGPRQDGITVHVSDDGTVERSSPGAHDLVGVRLFTLPATDARQLLALLQAAQPERDEQGAESSTVADFHDGPRESDEAVRPRQPVREYEFASPRPDRPAMVAEETAHDGPQEQQSDSTDVVTTNETISAANEQAEHATTPTAGSASTSCRQQPLHLNVLGQLHLTRSAHEHRDIIDVFTPRQQELLVCLALYPGGCRRDTVNAALWPDAPTARPYNSFHTSLSQLRRTLRDATGGDVNDITVRRGHYYGLDPTTVTVDLWQLHDQLTVSRRCTRQTEANEALRRVTDLYRGDLAEDNPAEWIVGPREALRREVLDAFSSLIRTTRREDAEEALALLERARRLDPYNEAIYRDLMRLQARLGQYDSILRTLQLLKTSLSEIDQEAAGTTIKLANELVSGGGRLPGQRAS
ncbi:BTAD domain-containing putative transcriptional regulator [Amycolatopsis sp. WGS_07]|uniref:BTAD domain-containing putative transcriptional regulator n=1 Tax=Amycolatopsis sp. WGS_07 TaxID=3076764 RepID=UPI0038736034